MNFPDQYHAAAVWQQHLLDEQNQRRLAELVARRQRRRPHRRLRDLVAVVARWAARRRTKVAPVTATPTRPAGCAV